MTDGECANPAPKASRLSRTIRDSLLKPQPSLDRLFRHYELDEERHGHDHEERQVSRQLQVIEGADDRSDEDPGHDVP